MLKHVVATVAIGLGLAACGGSSSTPPLPPVWSATYAVPFDGMVSCLSAKPGGAFAVSAPEFYQEGVVTISFTPNKTPEAASAYTVRRVDSGNTLVNWRRPGNVGGLDWLDTEARSRADRCGNA
jgi:hypothetical protein